MNAQFFTNLLNKGKALIENVKPSFMKSSKEISEICEGLINIPNQSDTKKINNENAYFSPCITPEFFSTILIVVGFNHKKGAVIEYTYPEEEKKHLQNIKYEQFVKNICFMSIPDAAHTLDVIHYLSIE